MYELTITSYFSSAHNLRGYQGACENLHGHNWKVEVEISAEALDKVGMALDFKSLREKARAVIDRLGHKYLNELPPLDVVIATAENIARDTYGELKKRTDPIHGAGQKEQVPPHESVHQHVRGPAAPVQGHAHVQVRRDLKRTSGRAHGQELPPGFGEDEGAAGRLHRPPRGRVPLFCREE